MAAYFDKPNLYPRAVEELPMFHLISREGAEGIVQKHCLGKKFDGVGTYLLRPSTNKDPSFFSITVSVSCKNEIRNLRVNITYNEAGAAVQYYLKQSCTFPNILALLRHYKDNPIKCDENINVRLLRGLAVIKPKKESSEANSPFIRRHSESQEPDQQALESSRHPNLGATGRQASEPSRQTSSPTTHLPARSASLHGSSSSNSRRDSHNQRSPSTSSSVAAGSVPQTQKHTVDPSSSSTSNPGLTSPQQHQVSRSSSSTPDKLPYANFSAMTSADPRFRPALPLPVRSNNDLDPENQTYFEVDTKRDFFEETYRFLKESELCECGLRVIDSTLPLGWAVHRMASADLQQGKIFFQSGNSTTAWELPPEVVAQVTEDQADFMIELCEKLKCKLPACLTGFTRRKNSGNVVSWSKAA